MFAVERADGEFALQGERSEINTRHVTQFFHTVTNIRVGPLKK